MQTTSCGERISTTCVRVTDPPLELSITPKAFSPNPTTVRFARTVRVAPGEVVFDIGTGIGPLAIKAAMSGAAMVYAVDPVDMHCELARMNIAKYGLEERIQVFQGSFFDPFDEDPELRGVRADVIIGDVSGIADTVAHALGWYSEEVPTGGEDGTDVIIELLRRAGEHMAPEGALYFPIAIDLSDSDKILRVARELFGEVENAMERPTTQFPIDEAGLAAIEAAYGSHMPSYITIQKTRRPHWRGQIWKAAHPVG